MNSSNGKSLKSAGLIFSFLLIIIFGPLSLGYSFWNSSQITLKDLTFVKGRISDFRIIQSSSRILKTGKKVISPVMVFKVNDLDERYGVSSQLEEFKIFESILEKNPSPEVEFYYNPEGGRIEEDVTLHIYNMKIDNRLLYSIEESSSSKIVYSIVFFSFGLGLFAVFVYIFLLFKRQ